MIWLIDFSSSSYSNTVHTILFENTSYKYLQCIHIAVDTADTSAIHICLKFNKNGVPKCIKSHSETTSS